MRSFVIPFSILLVFSGQTSFRFFLASVIPIFGFSLTLALTALVVLIIKITQFVTVHAVQQKVESILTASQRKEIAPKELNQQLDLLDSKLLRLEENLQKVKIV